MAESPTRADELRQLIEAAFAETKYPGDDWLVDDNSGYHLECNEVAAAFRGKHWKQVPLEMLSFHSAGIFYFTPEAYRFYLPAYLIAAALHYHEVDTMPDSLVFSLTPPADARHIEIYRKRMEGFTPQQREAIRSFLQFLKAKHPEDDVLGDVDKALANL